MPTFEERFNDLMDETGRTQLEVADYLGMKTRNLRYYLSGKYKPTPEQLVKLAALFGVSIGYLAGVEDEPGQAPVTQSTPIVLTGADRRLLKWIYDDPNGVDLMNALDESEAKRLLAIWKILRDTKSEGNYV